MLLNLGSSELDHIRDELTKFIKTLEGSTPRPFISSLPCPQIEIASWLSSSNSYPKFYWENRDNNFELGGIGAALSFRGEEGVSTILTLRAIEEQLRSHPQASKLKFFGGAMFNPSEPPSEEWEPFGRSWFTHPALLITRHDSQYEISVAQQVSLESNIEKTVEEIATKFLSIEKPRNEGPLPVPSIISRTDVPEQGAWVSNLAEVAREIHAGNLDKVVLARKTALTLSEHLHPISFLRSLKAREAGTFAYACAPNEDTAFFGASPELFCSKQGSQLECDALGGTVPRFSETTVDQNKEQELKNTSKYLEEHAFVRDDIIHKVEKLVQSVKSSSHPEVIKLKEVQHLRTRISGKLKDDVTLSELIDSLHPTPAVGGKPLPAAMKTIQSNEAFARGWYAGPVGLISAESTELAVALRSALSYKSQMSLFAGAGIVDGSQANDEWIELESKITASLNLFPEEHAKKAAAHGGS